MSHKLVSVIIPFYNLESYIKRCLDSILAQTYSNLEILAVDDGSIDGTSEILSAYAKMDRRVIHIRQDNAGAGAASNKGIEMARGEYLTFVDNDDWIEPTMYEQLVGTIERNNAEMSVCNFNLIYSDRNDNCYGTMRSGVEDIYDDVYGYFCKHCACTRPNNYIWTRLYRAGIVKNSGIRFENFRLGADTLFNFKLLPLQNRVAFINEGLYNYVQRVDSGIHTAALKENLAGIYADGFEALADYYISGGFKEFLSVLPIHAFTRLRSVYFYSRLAGLNDDTITGNIAEGFKGRKIFDYLTGAVK